MRQDPPARELRRIAGLPRIQKHEPERESGRQAKGGLEGEVSLARGGQQCAIPLRRPLRQQIQMSFKAVLSP